MRHGEGVTQGIGIAFITHTLCCVQKAGWAATLGLSYKCALLLLPPCLEGLMGACVQNSSWIFWLRAWCEHCQLSPTQLPLIQASHALTGTPVCRAIGIIFGDVGTSPLYVFASIFSAPPTHEDIMGTTSMIFWTLTLVALIK